MKLSDVFVSNALQAVEKRGISKSELARRVGIDPASTAKYLSGKTKPGIDVIEKFAEALGVSPAWLLDANSSMNNLSGSSLRRDVEVVGRELIKKLEQVVALSKKTSQVASIVESFDSKQLVLAKDALQAIASKKPQKK